MVVTIKLKILCLLNPDPEPDEKPDPDPYNKLRIWIRMQEYQKHTDPATAPNPEHYLKLKEQKNTLFGLSLTRHCLPYKGTFLFYIVVVVFCRRGKICF